MKPESNSAGTRVALAVLAGVIGVLVAMVWLRREPAEQAPPAAAPGLTRELDVSSPAELPPRAAGEFDFSDTALSDDTWELPTLKPHAFGDDPPFPPAPDPPRRE